MKIVHAILVSSLLFTGCTSKVWYQDGKSLIQTQQAFAQCQIMANLGVPAGDVQYIPGEGSGGAFLANALSQNGQRNDLIKECMIAKGYQWIPAKDVPPPITPAQGLRNVESWLAWFDTHPDGGMLSQPFNGQQLFTANEVAATKLDLEKLVKQIKLEYPELQ